MSPPPGDDDVGYGRPPKRTRFPKGESGNRNRRYRKRSEGRTAMLTRLLLKPVEITVSGEIRKVAALKAILLQLRAKELEGHPRATAIRLKYEEFARQNSQRQPQIVFVDSDYTRALANNPSKEEDDRDL
jgi:hypothetical protein